MEGFGDHPNTLQSTIHNWNVDGHGGKQECAIAGDFAAKKYWCHNTTETFDGKMPDLTSGYHVYTLEWLPDHVTWFLDGNPYYVFTGTDKVPVTSIPMGFIIDFAMGDTWDGPVQPETPFPAVMDVKSVKIWALKPHS